MLDARYMHEQNSVMQSRHAGCNTLTCNLDNAEPRLRTLRLWARLTDPARSIRVSHNVRNAGSCIATIDMFSSRVIHASEPTGACATPTLFNYCTV